MRLQLAALLYEDLVVEVSIDIQLRLQFRNPLVFSCQFPSGSIVHLFDVLQPLIVGFLHK